MKLVTFTDSDGTRIGIVKDDSIVDLSATNPDLPTDMTALLKGGDDLMGKVRIAEESAEPTLTIDAVTLRAPVPHPGKILAIGLNYGDHIEETGMQKPEHQIWFNKQHNCINDPYAGINMPAVSTMLDYEAELCIVIGKTCKHVPRERAHEVVVGYMVGDDVTVRDWQLQSPTMQIGKSFDTHGPTGPWLVTPDEIGDPHDLNIRGFVNGEQRQSSNTKHLIFDCYDQIAHLTKSFTLDPGDILFTGTPAGVGIGHKPPLFLVEGDVVRIEIDGIGHIENKVVKENAQTVIG